MKSRIFFAVFALLMSVATLAEAQGRGGRHNYDRNGYNDHDRGYNDGRGHNGYYQNRGGYNNGGNCNNGYGRGRRVYRRPVTYCAPAPVVYAAPPRYYAPRPVMYRGRPRVNINIGF